MDIKMLAQEVASFLTPFLPYLLKSGEKAIEEVSKRIGEDVWKSAKALWNKLFPKVEAKPAAIEAAQDVASDPDSKGALNALTWQLEKLFASDQTLAQDVKLLLEQAQVTQNTKVSVQGNRNVTIGGDASGNTIITGDDNTLGK